MEMSTQTKSFLLLLLAPCLALFICQLPRYLLAFSQPWKEVLPAPPANSVMIAGANQTPGSYPTFVRTKDGKYYGLVGSSRNEKWIISQNVDQESRKNLLESEYNLSNPLIPFLFNRPPGTVIDHFYTEHVRTESGWPRYAVYYVLLDGGTLWSWSEPLLVDDYKALNRFSVIFAAIVFVVTGIMLLVMNRVPRTVPFRKLRKQNKLLFLIFIDLLIGAVITSYILKSGIVIYMLYITYYFLLMFITEYTFIKYIL